MMMCARVDSHTLSNPNAADRCKRSGGILFLHMTILLMFVFLRGVHG